MANLAVIKDVPLKRRFGAAFIQTPTTGKNWFGLVPGVGSVGFGETTLSLVELERSAIERAREETRGNRSEMARLLGIGRTTLYRKLRLYGIED